MSVKIMATIWEREDLDPFERLVLLSIADHADERGACYPSIARLCQRTGISERGVQRVIRRLVEREMLDVESGKGRHVRNRYQFRNPAPESPFQDGNPAPGAPFPAENPPPGHPLNGRNPAPESENPAPGADETSRTKKERKKERTRALAHANGHEVLDTLSAVVGLDRATAFVAHRKALKAPMTSQAANLMAKRLSAMADPGEAIDRSIENGWKGVFENGRKGPQRSRSEEFTDAFLAGARRV